MQKDPASSVGYFDTVEATMISACGTTDHLQSSAASFATSDRAPFKESSPSS